MDNMHINSRGKNLSIVNDVNTNLVKNFQTVLVNRIKKRAIDLVFQVLADFFKHFFFREKPK